MSFMSTEDGLGEERNRRTVVEIPPGSHSEEVDKGEGDEGHHTADDVQP
jgi:hypothetical protein